MSRIGSMSRSSLDAKYRKKVRRPMSAAAQMSATGKQPERALHGGGPAVGALALPQSSDGRSFHVGVEGSPWR